MKSILLIQNCCKLSYHKIWVVFHNWPVFVNMLGSTCDLIFVACWLMPWIQWRTVTSPLRSNCVDSTSTNWASCNGRKGTTCTSSTGMQKNDSLSPERTNIRWHNRAWWSLSWMSCWAFAPSVIRLVFVCPWILLMYFYDVSERSMECIYVSYDSCSYVFNIFSHMFLYSYPVF